MASTVSRNTAPRARLLGRIEIEEPTKRLRVGRCLRAAGGRSGGLPCRDRQRQKVFQHLLFALWMRRTNVTEAGAEPLKGPRDIAAAKKMVAESGYNGEPSGGS